MSEAPDVALTIAGDPWDQWDRLEITLSFEELAPRFTFELFDPREDDEIFPFGEGDECTIDVRLPGDTVYRRLLTGYVERPEIRDGPDDGDVGITVTGGSKTIDLVQCHTTARRWNDATLAKIARDLCSPFGITAYSFEAGEPIKRFETRPGDSVASALQSAAELRGLIATSDENGDVVLTTAEDQTSGIALRVPGNIIRGTYVGDFTDRFSQYTVYSQRVPEKRFAQALAAGMAVEVRDDQVKRFRPFYDVSDRDEKQAQLEARAKHIRNVRAGRSSVYSCDVNSWDNGRGVVWRPNTIVNVRHPRCGIDDDLLISRVVLMADARDGFTANLGLARRETFDILAEPEGKGRGRRSRF